MKKINLILIHLSFTLFIPSCNKDDDRVVQPNPKPIGKYITEIKLYGFWSDRLDTYKLAQFEYDDKRYLKTVKLYNIGKEKIGYYQKYFYNQNAQINQVELYDIDSNLVGLEKFIYQNKNLTYYEKYMLESNALKLNKKFRFNTDSENQAIDVYEYYHKGDILIEPEYYTKYYFDDYGNIFKEYYKEDGLEFIDEFEYDNMKNPFKNLDIPFCDNTFQVIYPLDYLSNNNVTYHKKTYLDYRIGSDTISGFSIDTINYIYENGFPIEEDSFFFYEYLNLE